MKSLDLWPLISLCSPFLQEVRSTDRVHDGVHLPVTWPLWPWLPACRSLSGSPSGCRSGREPSPTWRAAGQQETDCKQTMYSGDISRSTLRWCERFVCPRGGNITPNTLPGSQAAILHLLLIRFQSAAANQTETMSPKNVLNKSK